jgi:hypothetical protein
MTLTRLEREAINDSVLKIQSIQVSLDQVDKNKIPDFQGIESCLDTAHKTLRTLLRNGAIQKGISPKTDFNP